MKLNTACILMALLMAGCISRYPMGLTREQWEALPPSEQAELQAKQYTIDENRRQANEARRMEQARIAAEEAQAEQERLRQVYANARYGDIVTVSAQGGFLSYSGKRYPYEPVGFDLVKGETKRVLFRGRGIQTIATEYMVRLSEDGNTIYFDDKSRRREVFVNHDWEHGETYRPEGTVNDVSVGLSGMTFFVRLKNLPGGPAKMIIENR